MTSKMKSKPSNLLSRIQSSKYGSDRMLDLVEEYLDSEEDLSELDRVLGHLQLLFLKELAGNPNPKHTFTETEERSYFQSDLTHKELESQLGYLLTLPREPQYKEVIYESC